MRGFSVWSAVGAALFVAANAWATSQRGYWAVGGEAFLLLLPLWAWAARVIVEEGRRDDGYDWQRRARVLRVLREGRVPHER